MDSHENEKQERESRTAGRTDVLVVDDIAPAPASPLLIPPPDEETPSHAPIQDVHPIDGESVLHPPKGAEPHKLGQLQG